MTYVYRYNPASATGRAVRVRSDSPEAEEWPSRRPRKLPKEVQREISRTAAGVVKAGLPAVAAGATAARRALPAVAAAGLSAAYVAAAGMLAYAATKAVLDGKAEADTVENSVAKARSMAVTAFHQRLGRMPTHEEYADMRKRIGDSIADGIRAMQGSLTARWRLFIQLFKGG